MAEPAQTGVIIAAASAIGAAVVGAFKWLLHREIKRIDDHHTETREAVSELDRRVNVIERTVVTQAGVDAATSRLEAALAAHGASMQDSLRALHQRVDRLYEQAARRPE